MITVVVVAIIAAIAVPSYQQYIERKDLAIARKGSITYSCELEPTLNQKLSVTRF